jgi:excisionase family DNA binding protein
MSQEPFVPIETLAKHFTVSVSTIRAWLRQGYIPSDTYVKIGNTYRFNVSAVVQALSAKPKDDVKMIEPENAEPIQVQLELDFNNPDQDI